MIKKLTFEEIQEKQPDLERLSTLERCPAVVIADNIRSLHNVGALFRTSDAVRLRHLYLCGITGQPPRDEIRKTSLGAEESVPWSYVRDPNPLVEELKQQGYQIIALEHTNSSCDFRRANYQFPVCLLIGHEYQGVGQSLLDKADVAVEIPMHGIKQSLNVSVAYGVMIYELLRQYEQQSEIHSYD